MEVTGYRASLRLAALALAAWATASGCATTPDSSSLRGTSGPVAWEVVDIRQYRPNPDKIEWRYTVVLKETAGIGISFQRGDAGFLGPRINPSPTEFQFARRLNANAELQIPWWSSVTLYTTGQVGRLPGGHEGGTQLLRLYGKDDTGKPITVVIRIPLDPYTGTRTD